MIYAVLPKFKFFCKTFSWQILFSKILRLTKYYFFQHLSPRPPLPPFPLKISKRNQKKFLKIFGQPNPPSPLKIVQTSAGKNLSSKSLDLKGTPPPPLDNVKPLIAFFTQRLPLHKHHSFSRMFLQICFKPNNIPCKLFTVGF